LYRMLAKAAREHDRHDRIGLGWIGFRHLAQHAYTPHLPVLHVAPQLCLQLARSRAEGRAVPVLDGKQRGRGEVADDSIDLIMQRQTVEYSEVDGEPLTPAPGR